MENRRRKNRQGKGVNGRRIVLITSGGISVYKSAYLCRVLKRGGADVRVAMTEAATRFITPLTFETLTGNPVEISLFTGPGDPSVPHIDLSEWAERIVAAPATADFLARIASGMADDLPSGIISASGCPVLLVPAMNDRMWLNPATRRNVRTLREYGYIFVQPEEGELACGKEGIGRMAEPEEIARKLTESFEEETMLAGKKILVTAGRTEEDIDSVRYISNRSSGRMGCAIAGRASKMGAEVTLVYGAVDVPLPGVGRTVAARGAEEMKNAVLEEFGNNDVLIMAAAVSDYTPVSPVEGKMRRDRDSLKLEFRKTEDILKIAGERKSPGQKTVGFALEYSEDDEKAMEKLRGKNCDMLVLNLIGEKTGFTVSTNRISLYAGSGRILTTRLIPKEEAAGVILKQLAKGLEDE